MSNPPDDEPNWDAIWAARHAILALDKVDASYAILSALEHHPKCKAIFRSVLQHERAVIKSNRKVRKRERGLGRNRAG